MKEYRIVFCHVGPQNTATYKGDWVKMTEKQRNDAEYYLSNLGSAKTASIKENGVTYHFGANIIANMIVWMEEK